LLWRARSYVKRLLLSAFGRQGRWQAAAVQPCDRRSNHAMQAGRVLASWAAFRRRCF
jgi:hypothetical protein